MDSFLDRAHDALKKAAAPTLDRIEADASTPNVPDVLIRFLRYLSENLFDPQLTVGKARRASGSRDNALTTRFGDYFGVTAGKYIERRRIETAERMLRGSDVTVGRIAREVGYNSRSTFYEAYERVTGEKPKKAERRTVAPEIDYRTWRRWLRGELAEDEVQRVLDVTGSLYPQPDLRTAGELRPPRIVVDGRVYERSEAEKIWETLCLRPFEEQQGIVRGYLFHSTALFDLLRKKSREEGRKDRRLGIKLARLALVSLEGHEEVFGDRIHDLRALGWAGLANARRLSHDFERAEADFERADAEWSFPRVRKDSRVAAEIQWFEGTLRMFQRRHNEALGLLNKALDASREADDRDLEAHVLAQRGALHGYADRELESMTDLQAAAELTVELHDPHLSYYASLNLTNTQARFGNFDAAAKCLARTKAEWKSYGHPLGLCEIRHLEGNIHEGFGEMGPAESCYDEALRGFSDLGEKRLWALVALDQMMLYYGLGRAAETTKLTASTLPILQSMKLYPETLAAIRLLAEEAVELELREDLLLRVRKLLLQDPLLRLR